MPFPSALTTLECSYCAEQADPALPQRTCSTCGKVLLARYDAKTASRTLTKDSLPGRATSIWRYRELLPVQDDANIVSLGEGWTPILPAPRLGDVLGFDDLLLKDEGLNPTGTFKPRGLSAAISKAKELDLTDLVIPTAGNAGGALAAYAAAAGSRATVFMPRDAPLANQIEVIAAGARLELVDGVISDAGRHALAAAEQHGWFDVSTLKEPYRLEGKKTMGFEIAEQRDWSLPDVICYPTGGGTGLIGIWKAFDELQAIGLIDDRRPRMIAVQAAGCAPIVQAFDAGAEFAEPIADPQTIAAGLRVPAAISDYLILRTIRDSGGTAIAVDDAAILDAVGLLARTTGILAAPEAAALIAALPALRERGDVRPGERILLLLTGSGLKYLDLLTGLGAT